MLVTRYFKKTFKFFKVATTHSLSSFEIFNRQKITISKQPNGKKSMKASKQKKLMVLGLFEFLKQFMIANFR